MNTNKVSKIKKSGLKYFTDVTSNNQLINCNKLSTRSIKRINSQQWAKLRNTIYRKSTTEVKHKYRIKIDDEELINGSYRKENSIKEKEKTLVWMDSSIQTYENKKIKWKLLKESNAF